MYRSSNCDMSVYMYMPCTCLYTCTYTMSHVCNIYYTMYMYYTMHMPVYMYYTMHMSVYTYMYYTMHMLVYMYIPCKVTSYSISNTHSSPLAFKWLRASIMVALVTSFLLIFRILSPAFRQPFLWTCTEI